MIQVSSLAMQFDGKYLFKDVNLKFVKGNCYGHGTTYVINELIESGVNYLAVSSLEEAEEARRRMLRFDRPF